MISWKIFFRNASVIFLHWHKYMNTYNLESDLLLVDNLNYQGQKIDIFLSTNRNVDLRQCLVLKCLDHL